MDRHALKIIAKELTVGEIVRITSDEETFHDLVDRIVLFKAQKALDESFAKGYVPSQQEMAQAMDTATEKMKKGDLFVELVKDVIAEELVTKMQVTNEEMDIS